MIKLIGAMLLTLLMSCDEDGRSEAYWARCTCGWSASVGDRGHIASAIARHKSGGCRR